MGLRVKDLFELVGIAAVQAVQVVLHAVLYADEVVHQAALRRPSAAMAWWTAGRSATLC